MHAAQITFVDRTNKLFSEMPELSTVLHINLHFLEMWTWNDHQKNIPKRLVRHTQDTRIHFAKIAQGSNNKEQRLNLKRITQSEQASKMQMARSVFLGLAPNHYARFDEIISSWEAHQPSCLEIVVLWIVVFKYAQDHKTKKQLHNRVHKSPIADRKRVSTWVNAIEICGGDAPCPWESGRDHVREFGPCIRHQSFKCFHFLFACRSTSKCIQPHVLNLYREGQRLISKIIMVLRINLSQLNTAHTPNHGANL